jgi:hypothetical protein
MFKSTFLSHAAAVMTLAVMFCMTPRGDSLLHGNILNRISRNVAAFQRSHLATSSFSTDAFDDAEREESSEDEEFLPSNLLSSAGDDIIDTDLDVEEAIEVEEAEQPGPVSGRGRKKTKSKNKLIGVEESDVSSIVTNQQVMRTKTWEERFDDDPLRADVPTKDFDKPPDRFAKRYFLVSKPFSSLERREELWIPHLQWARRSALALPNEKNTAAVISEFTLLSSDRMSPTAQVRFSNILYFLYSFSDIFF